MRLTEDGDVILSRKHYDELLDLANRYYAIMEDLPVDFEDMYPDWGDDDVEDFLDDNDQAVDIQT